MEPLKIGELINKPQSLVMDGSNQLPTYVFSGTLDTTLYTDITSNVKWMSVGVTEYDYLFCRNQVMMLSAITGWDNLSTSDKTIAAKYYCVDKTKRDSVLSDDEQLTNWTSLVIHSHKARDNRWKIAKSYISYYLSPIDSVDISQTTNTLSHNYIEYGIESFSTDGMDGLFDWIGNTSTFSGGTGFNGKLYWTQPYQDKLLSILKDGIY